MHRSFAGMWALLVPSYQAKPKRAGGQENRLRLQVRAYPGLGALSAEMVQPHCDHVTGLSVAERELTLRHRLLGGFNLQYNRTPRKARPGPPAGFYCISSKPTQHKLISIFCRLRNVELVRR